jgi:amino acid transporter
MSADKESNVLHDSEKHAPPYQEPASLGEHLRGRQLSVTSDDVAIVEADQNKLHRNLKGRHMQMIAM